jgi:hypothetical protein
VHGLDIIREGPLLRQENSDEHSLADGNIAGRATLSAVLITLDFSRLCADFGGLCADFGGLAWGFRRPTFGSE